MGTNRKMKNEVVEWMENNKNAFGDKNMEWYGINKEHLKGWNQSEL